MSADELSYAQWPFGVPPRDWMRVLAVDVGGSTPWGWLWSAVDPWHNVIFYDEIYETTDRAPDLVERAKPRMRDPENGEEYQFRAKVIDYENKIAAEDLRRMGISMTNARKHDKASSIERLKGYFHPNPKHHFPPWHPRAGQPGSPRAFVMARCRNFRRELPMARWLAVNGMTKNEMDRKTGNHLIDCALYTIRELPPPFELKPAPALYMSPARSGTAKMSELYWYDKAKLDEFKKRNGIKDEVQSEIAKQAAADKALEQVLRRMRRQGSDRVARTLAGLSRVD